MKLFDRSRFRARINERLPEQSNAALIGRVIGESVLDEIEAALPGLLQETRLDLIELAGLRLVAHAGVCEKAARNGETAGAPEAAHVEILLERGANRLDAVHVEVLRLYLLSKSAENIRPYRESIRADLPPSAVDDAVTYTASVGWRQPLPATMSADVEDRDLWRDADE